MTKSLTSLHREFFEQLGKKLNVKNLDDWYKFGVSTVSREGGRSILQFYSGGTVSREGFLKALAAAYPENEWYPWKFSDRIPKHFWEETKNQKSFLKHLQEKLQLKRIEDFYSVSKGDFEKNGGIGLLRIYDNSLFEMLKKNYPDYKWIPWCFKHFTCPNGFWKQKENVKQFVFWAEQKLGVKKWTDWFRISQSQFTDIGGHTALADYGGMLKVLAQVYPQHDWDVDMKKMPSKGHRFIFSLLHDTFKKTNHDIYLNYVHSDLKFFGTGRAIQFDIYMPSLRLAFEYHGPQHYTNTGRLEMNMSERKQLDDEKRKLCKENNITLVELPFWWNHEKRTLIEEILSQKPELTTEINWD